MTKRNEVEEEIERYRPAILQFLEQNDPKNIRPDIGAWSGIAAALTTFALYDSSKKIENYSKWLKRLTVALVILTVVLAYFAARLDVVICARG